MFSSRMQPGIRKGHKYHKCSTACESSVMKHLSLRGKGGTCIELFQCLATCQGGIWRNQCIFCQIIWRYLQSLVSQGIFNFLHPFIQSLNLFIRLDSTWLEGIQLSLELSPALRCFQLGHKKSKIISTTVFLHIMSVKDLALFQLKASVFLKTLNLISASAPCAVSNLVLVQCRYFPDQSIAERKSVYLHNI